MVLIIITNLDSTSKFDPSSTNDTTRRLEPRRSAAQQGTDCVSTDDYLIVASYSSVPTNGTRLET